MALGRITPPVKLLRIKRQIGTSKVTCPRRSCKGGSRRLVFVTSIIVLDSDAPIRQIGCQYVSIESSRSRVYQFGTARDWTIGSEWRGYSINVGCSFPLRVDKEAVRCIVVAGSVLPYYSELGSLNVECCG